MKKNIFWLLLLPFLMTACQQDKPKKQTSADSAAAKTEMPQPTEDELAESLFQLPDTFRNQDNQPVVLSDFKGKPMVVSMIFTHCAFVCPRLTADIRQLEQSMGEEANKVNFVLITFDVERDTPERLKQYAKDQNLDQNFTLLHGSESAVRSMGVLLDIQFEKDEDGNFAHSNIVTVLDPYGIVRYRKEGLGQDHTQTVKEVEKYL